jgi:2-polyprenyl-3-methyl-5-hydroxy-6-metoxy-1,4-benzoquinol methylase
MKPLTSANEARQSKAYAELRTEHPQPTVGEPEPRVSNPFTGATWAAQSEAYAELISEHLHPNARWLDAGCGWRLLEDDLEALEDWLVQQCGTVIGMDVVVNHHRNIKQLVEGSLNALPFADDSLDLVTCNMVVEHLDEPSRALAEIARCLRPGGAVVINTPNLLNYGILANAVATKLLPENLRLRIVHTSDTREPDDIFPVRYRANTLRRLVHLLEGSGLQVHKAQTLRQQRPFLRKAAKVERYFMKLTPHSRLLVCACKKR